MHSSKYTRGHQFRAFTARNHQHETFEEKYKPILTTTVHYSQQLHESFNFVLRDAKTLEKFGHIECKRGSSIDFECKLVRKNQTISNYDGFISFTVILFLILSHDIAYESDITPCNTNNKPLVVYSGLQIK